jgi:hypothetical protein
MDKACQAALEPQIYQIRASGLGLEFVASSIANAGETQTDVHQCNAISSNCAHQDRLDSPRLSVCNNFAFRYRCSLARIRLTHMGTDSMHTLFHRMRRVTARSSVIGSWSQMLLFVSFYIWRMEPTT